MSRNGQVSPVWDTPEVADAVLVGDFPLGSGQWVGTHEHPVHQLVWGRQGVLAVRAGDSTWFLPPTRALWMPAGVVHDTGAIDACLVRSPFLPTTGCPIAWTEPTVVAVTPLLAALIDHLAAPQLDPYARQRAEGVVYDQLIAIPGTTIELRMPRDQRARAVADRVLRAPVDQRSLKAWAAGAATSERTLRRLFLAETGISFGQWQRQARLQATLPLLAAGASTATVARHAGYATPSAFVAAFRRTLGIAPSAYARLTP
jgi:AraC-like DNA-binding protein/quercetin dioxygenase-like cupin family protein